MKSLERPLRRARRLFKVPTTSVWRLMRTQPPRCPGGRASRGSASGSRPRCARPPGPGDDLAAAGEVLHRRLEPQLLDVEQRPGGDVRHDATLFGFLFPCRFSRGPKCLRGQAATARLQRGRGQALGRSGGGWYVAGSVALAGSCWGASRTGETSCRVDQPGDKRRRHGGGHLAPHAPARGGDEALHTGSEQRPIQHGLRRRSGDPQNAHAPIRIRRRARSAGAPTLRSQGPVTPETVPRSVCCHRV